jgi:CBS domain
MVQPTDTAGEPTTDYRSWRFRIDQLMRHPAVAIGPHDSVEKAASLMAAHGIHALPVIDAQEKLVGIITQTDVMRAVLHPKRHGSGEAGSGSPAKTARVAPTAPEMDRALSLAAAASGGADETAEIARALLHACARLQQLEALRSWADRYVHVGRDERWHSALITALEKTHDQCARSAPLPV